MTDHHVHIGNFKEAKYDFRDILSALRNNGVDGCVCAYLVPSFPDLGAEEAREKALECSRAALAETEAAAKFAGKIGLDAKFLYWADSAVLQGTSVEAEYAKFAYGGIAIHPFYQDWSGTHSGILTEMFEFARKEGAMLYLHTGCSPQDNPLQFERWFAQFPDVHVRLAHCKDAGPIIELFKKYPNLTGDTAFCPADSYGAICRAGFADRMFFGTDFPVTHYFEHSKDGNWENNAELLTRHYARAVKENAMKA